MPNISTIIPTKPFNELIDSIGINDYENINVFLDVKNISVGCFIPDIINEIVDNTESYGSQIDSTIFQSLIHTTSDWFSFLRPLNKKVSIYLNSDSGTSFYHKSLIPKYKSKRKNVKSTLTESISDKFQEIRHKNINMAENVLNKIPDVYFFNMKYIDSDFLSYYLIKRFNSLNTLNIVCSGDKDIYQNLLLPNTVIFYKYRGTNQIYDKNNFLSSYINKENFSEKSRIEKMKKITQINPEYFSLMLSLTGDASDEIPGCSGIGPGAAVDILSSDLVSGLMGSPSEFRKRVLEQNKAINTQNCVYSNLDKKWKKVIEDEQSLVSSYKAVDFDCLIDWFESDVDCHKNFENRNYMEKILKKEVKQVDNPDVLKNFISKLNDCQLTEGNLNLLFK